MNDAGAVLRTDVLGHIHRRETLVAFMHIVQRVLEVQATQFVAGGGGHHCAYQLVAL